MLSNVLSLNELILLIFIFSFSDSGSPLKVIFSSKLFLSMYIFGAMNIPSSYSPSNLYDPIFLDIHSPGNFLSHTIESVSE